MYNIVVTIVAILFMFFDVGYYIRTTLTILYSAFFQRRAKATDTTVIYGICTTRDVDFFFTHMNNARYLRELDFARIHYYYHTGLYQKIKTVNGQALVGATNIRYRRSIDLFGTYKIETKLVYWEGKTIFLEHKFITLKDGFVRAIILSRQHLIGLDAPSLLAEISASDKPMTCPVEISQWQEALETTSVKLRKKE